MVTNNTESPPGCTKPKQYRVIQIRGNYFSPPPDKKITLPASNTSLRTHTTLYPHDNSIFFPQQIFEVRNDTTTHGLALFVSSAICIAASAPGGRAYFGEWWYALLAPALCAALYFAVRFFNAKLYLSVSGSGLYFTGSRLFIPWQRVAATHIIENEAGRKANAVLEVTYTDAACGELRTELLDITVCSKEAGEIAMAITWYQQGRNLIKNQHDRKRQYTLAKNQPVPIG